VTAWTVALSENGNTITADADEITTRTDGSLWLLAAAAPPPDKLRPVVVLARGRWIAVYPAGADPFDPQPEATTPTPRFA
jgi:hypothetical protein